MIKAKKTKDKKTRKKISAKPAKIKTERKPEPKTERYFEAMGRRKTAWARIRLWTGGEKTFLVNGKPLDVYFKSAELQQITQAPLEKMDFFGKFRISALVKGGGLHAQAEAVRQGIARALALFNPDFRKRLKRAGFLTRDPRMRERKKFGLKRARRAPQWQKR